MISNIKKSDEGKYICVGNSIGGIKEGSALLKVLGKFSETNLTTYPTLHEYAILFEFSLILYASFPSSYRQSNLEI